MDIYEEENIKKEMDNLLEPEIQIHWELSSYHASSVLERERERAGSGWGELEGVD